MNKTTHLPLENRLKDLSILSFRTEDLKGKVSLLSFTF